MVRKGSQMNDNAFLVLERLNTRLNDLERLHAKYEARMGLFDESISSLESELQQKQQDTEILEIVNRFLSDQIAEKITETKYKLQSLVNQGLEYVFPHSNITIEIESTFKFNKTQFSLIINKDKVNSGRLDAFGGGVLSVIALLLRISAIIITSSERLVFLDESLAFLSKQYQALISKFLKQISRQLGFTIILIAHQEDLSIYADTIIEAQGDPKTGITFETKDSILS